MLAQEREKLRAIKTFPSLVKYLREELDWPIETDDFDEVVFDYEPEELGIDPETAVKVDEIKQLRPLITNQPWGIFFIKFEPKRLPVVVLRRILSRLVFKKRASANKSEQASWNLDDLLFISNYGEDEQRQITFAHFAQDKERGDLPTLKVLGWDDADTALHLDHCHQELKGKLHWPDDEHNLKDWREKWSSVFILRHREVITTSKDLAMRLADLARRVRSRANRVLAFETEQGHLRNLYKSFQEALIHDLSEDDFADMYAQTIAYGLLAARVSRPMGVTADNIADMIPITNPFLKDMLGTFITAGGRKGAIDFDELGVQEVVELLNSPNTHMDAILRDFGNRTQQEDPVIHFYELFLSEYDKKKKVQRGIFYTPQPVVSYIVRSVHELLQNEFGLEDGLAAITTWGELVKRKPDIKIPEGLSPGEPFVQILDPATGTATFIVEVIDLIHKTMRAKWIKQGHMALETQRLWNEYVPKHLLPRLYGFELMMAPYAIAHMKLGLKLYETGYTFKADERVRVYLTNSLEPAADAIPQRVFEQWAPALANEARAVNTVKQNKCFTIVIGNPPYANYGQLNRIPSILKLLEDYKRGLNEKKLNLDDDYIKFIRFAQYQIERSAYGIVGFITNHAYLDGITHRQMRWHLLNTFTKCRILDLHGSTKKKEQPPNGEANENVFDITVGVAIGLFSRISEHINLPVEHADLWGFRNEKYKYLLSNTQLITKTNNIKPEDPYFFFVPKSLISDDIYQNGFSLTDIFGVWKNGIQTDRDDLFFDFDKEILEDRIQVLFSGEFDEEFRQQYRVYASSSFNIERRLAKSDYNSKNVKECLYRPFDRRWLYYDPELTSRPAYEVMRHLIISNLAILCSRQQGSLGFKHAFCTNGLTERCAVSLNSRECTYVFPLFLTGKAGFRLMAESETNANISERFVNELLKGMGQNSSTSSLKPKQVFGYVYSILFSPTYRHRYAEFLQIDFPRLPLASSIDLFRDLSLLGGQLVALHLMESPRLNTLITKWYGSTPSGEVEKVTYADETVWIDKGQIEGFRGVPEDVWNFHIGGYQVCEKWLKDRKRRVLSTEDITHYQKIVVALNETIRLMKEIDKVIDKHGGWPGAFVLDW